MKNIKKMIDIRYFWSKLFLKLHGVAIRDSLINPQASVSPGCNVIKSSLGRHSYLGVNTWAINAEIGAFCSIADNVYIGGAEHPISWLSTSPVFQNIKHSSSKAHYARHDWNPYLHRVCIGNDVWIGHGAVITQGVTIGNGAVIGANAVITKDVPPYAIVAGVPAKIIRFRFDDESIEILQNSKWWDWNDGRLKELGEYVKDDYMNYFSKILGGGVHRLLPYDKNRDTSFCHWGAAA